MGMAAIEHDNIIVIALWLVLHLTFALNIRFVYSHLQNRPWNPRVIVSAVDEGSIAECSGIHVNDIIRSIGCVNSDQMDTFELKDVTEEKHVTSALTGQPTTVIGSVLIIQRPIITTYV